jgi:hypothetical protein
LQRVGADEGYVRGAVARHGNPVGTASERTPQGHYTGRMGWPAPGWVQRLQFPGRPAVGSISELKGRPTEVGPTLSPQKATVGIR